MSTDTDREFSTDQWRGEIGEALIATGIDTDQVSVTPDDVWTVTGADGSTASLGYDGEDEAGKEWWTVTTDATTDSFTAPSAAATAAVEWVNA